MLTDPSGARQVTGINCLTLTKICTIVVTVLAKKPRLLSLVSLSKNWKISKRGCGHAKLECLTLSCPHKVWKILKRGCGHAKLECLSLSCPHKVWN